MSEAAKAKIVSVGVMSPLGLTALQASLAFRASKLEPRRTPSEEAGVSHGMVRCRALPDSLRGTARVVTLARHALDDALRSWPIDHAAIDDGTVPLVLSLGETFDGSEVEPALAVLEDGAKVRFDRKRSETLRVGAAGFVVAIQRALTKLGSRGDGVIVVGTADSYFDPSRLDELHRSFRLHGTGTHDGFIPSEGAAFLVITGSSHPAPALAFVRAAAAGIEEHADEGDINLATEATRVVRHACTSASSVPLPWALTDSNGERHREREWTFAVVRNQAALEPGRTVVTKMPSGAGDAGAANGGLMAAHVAMSFQNGLTDARSALLSLASEGRERGALLLEAP